MQHPPLPSPPNRAWLEVAIWTLGLVVLALWGADLHGHTTFCIPTLLGIDGCIGCGVGHAAGLAMRGQLWESLAEHPLGIVAVVVLLIRIATVIVSNHRFAGGNRG